MRMLFKVLNILKTPYNTFRVILSFAKTNHQSNAEESMKRLGVLLLVLGSVLVFATSAHPQSNVCANNTVIGFTCGGPNNCSQFITLRQPRFGGTQTCLQGYIVYCCDQPYQDDSDSGEYCSFVCSSAVDAILKDPDASEFTLTHTLWAKDCSGHYRPFSRTWDVTRKPINLKPRLALSGIGG